MPPPVNVVRPFGNGLDEEPAIQTGDGSRETGRYGSIPVSIQRDRQGKEYLAVLVVSSDRLFAAMLFFRAVLARH